MTNYPLGIREFIVSNLLFGDDVGLGDDTSFLESGIIDSTGVLELIMFLESTYGVKVAPEEMLPENLDSINRVARFLTRKRANPEAPAVAAAASPA